MDWTKKLDGPLYDWVKQTAEQTKAAQIHIVTGSEDEHKSLMSQALEDQIFFPLNEKNYPNSYLHRSDPQDVARVEHLTFICTKEEGDAGPNNHWMAPEEGKSLLNKRFSGCMTGKTMYVIPYCMGPIDSPFSRCGVEITDSLYVVMNMLIMTRAGDQALERIMREGSFVKGLHSIGTLDPEDRYIMHFPEEKLIMSYGSGYGGNALLGKKCHALRIASWQAREEGWLAEHMLILGLENEKGEKHYIAAAFPSACGKTNLAMLIPPETFKKYKVTTIGDDICWLHPGKDGRLYAINPESGYFGVVPGTSEKTNPNALKTIQKNTIFTNVAVDADNNPWWEGLNDTPPPKLKDWKGNPWNPDVNHTPAAHPNARFTVSAKQCPSYSDDAESPDGVPISAILFGGRRSDLMPLVLEADDWAHGVLLGASVASETTAAATGQVGKLRRDPMAMKPFCGYHFGDYWSHWMKMGESLEHAPKIFHVNWFRKGEDGKFIWPGFGDNVRVLDWIARRCANGTDAVKTPVGSLPRPEDINIEGLSMDKKTLESLLEITPQEWAKEFDSIETFLKTFQDRLPEKMVAKLKTLQEEIKQ